MNRNSIAPEIVLPKIVVSEIIVYPIKSLAGVSLDSCQVNREGLEHDRMMMLVDDKGLFISQRKYSRLALLNVSLTSSGLRVSKPDASSIEICSSSFSEERMNIRIWNDHCYVFVAQKEINLWFSQFLDTSVRLIKYDSLNPRKTDPNYSKANDIVSFADGFPLLVIAQSSLDDLNSRLDIPVSMKNFRPNIVVKGCDAYTEDRWKKINIGEVGFDAVKLCSRCIMTTVNPSNGKRNKDGEPYKTLATYRKKDGNVYLGMNLIPRDRSIIRIADQVEAVALNT